MSQTISPEERKKRIDTVLRNVIRNASDGYDRLERVGAQYGKEDVDDAWVRFRNLRSHLLALRDLVEAEFDRVKQEHQEDLLLAVDTIKGMALENQELQGLLRKHDVVEMPDIMTSAEEIRKAKEEGWDQADASWREFNQKDAEYQRAMDGARQEIEDGSFEPVMPGDQVIQAPRTPRNPHRPPLLLPIQQHEYRHAD